MSWQIRDKHGHLLNFTAWIPNMSQTSLLDDIESWGPDECRAQVSYVLPKLISFLNETEDLETELVILQRICHNFVPCIAQEETELQVFKKIRAKTTHCFDNSIKKVSGDTVGHYGVEEILQILGVGLAIIECLEACVVHVNQSAALDPQDVHSLPYMVMHVLHGSYNHCKESSVLYGDILCSVSGHLSQLFKRAHSLQMAFIALLDKINLTTMSSDNDVHDMCQALQGVYKLTQVATSLDVKITITLWKTLSRLACQHKEVLFSQLNVDGMLSSLAEDMISSYHYLFTMVPTSQAPGDEKGFQKNVKVLGFQMKVLLMMVREYADGLHDCIQQLYSLILTLQMNLPPSIKSREVPQQYSEEIQRQVGIATEPLLNCLIANKTFSKVVLCKDQELAKNLYLPRCLTLVSIMDYLPNYEESVQEDWISPKNYSEEVPRDRLLEGVFKSAGKCGLELGVPVTLPGVMTQGKPQRDVSLHEHLVTRICGFVGCQSAVNFSKVEQTLIENVLCEDSNLAVLAIDIWCFVARYGTADLCQEHCYVLSDLLTQMTLTPTPQCCHLVVAFRRLFKFMAPEHQAEFIEKYSVEDHPVLWSVLPLSVLNATCLQQATEYIISAATKALQTWKSATDKTPRLAVNTVQSMQNLNNLYSLPVLLKTHPCPEFHLLLCERVYEFWDDTSHVDIERYPMLSHLVREVIVTTGYLLKDLESLKLYQILQKMSQILERSVHTAVKLVMLGCLGWLGKVFIPPSNEQKLALGELSKLFSQLLGDPNVAVKQVAMETFAQFAEETQHEMVVPETLQRNPMLQEVVVNHLNQVANKVVPELSTGNIEAQMESLKKFSDLPVSEKYPAASWPSEREVEINSAPTPEQPTAKRPRLDDDLIVDESKSMDEDCRRIINQFKKGVQDLQNIRRTLPAWAVDEMRTVHGHLGAMLS